MKTRLQTRIQRSLLAAALALPFGLASGADAPATQASGAASGAELPPAADDRNHAARRGTHPQAADGGRPGGACAPGRMDGHGAAGAAGGAGFAGMPRGHAGAAVPCRPGPGGHGGQAGHPGTHPGQRHGGAGHGAPYGPPPYLRGLALTEAQQDKVFNILHAQAPYMREQGKALGNARAALHALRHAAVYDDARAAQLAQAAAQAMSNLELARLRTDQKVLAVLTAEQRKQVEQNMAAMPPCGPRS